MGPLFDFRPLRANVIGFDLLIAVKVTAEITRQADRPHLVAVATVAAIAPGQAKRCNSSDPPFSCLFPLPRSAPAFSWGHDRPHLSALVRTRFAARRARFSTARRSASAFAMSDCGGSPDIADEWSLYGPPIVIAAARPTRAAFLVSIGALSLQISAGVLLARPGSGVAVVSPSTRTLRGHLATVLKDEVIQSSRCPQ